MNVHPPYTPIPMSRFIATLLKIIGTGLASFFVMSAIAVPTASDQSWLNWLKSFMTPDLWNKLSSSDKKKLKKAVSPQMWAEWLASFGENEEEEPFTQKISSTARSLGKGVGSMAANVGDIGHKLSESTSNVWHGMKRAVGAEGGGSSNIGEKLSEGTSNAWHGMKRAVGAEGGPRYYEGEQRPGVISKLKSYLPGMSKGQGQEQHGEEYEEGYQQQQQQHHQPYYYGEQQEFNQPYERYRSSSSKGQQLKETVKGMAQTTAANVQNAVSSGVDYLTGKSSQTSGGSPYPAQRYQQMQGGRNRGKASLEGDVTDVQRSGELQSSMPLRQVKQSTVIYENELPERRIQESMSHDVDILRQKTSGGVGAVHKKKKGTKLSGEEDLTAPKTEGSTLMPETVEKKKEVIYY